MAPVTAHNDRLRRLADDCEERARKSDSEQAIRLYRQVAPEARHAAVALYMGDRQRYQVLLRCEAMAMAARSYDGEALDGEVPAPPPAPIAEPDKPTGPLLNARQLAAAFGMGERGARKALERGYRRGLPGFHRDGALWFAEREAFAQFRIGAAAAAQGTAAE